jgi:electron transfer flavoprotein alpha subunit
MDSIFNESVVDKVLSSYFKENDTEKRLKEEKTAKKFIQSKIVKKTVMEEVKKLSETVEQELASDFILKENPQFIFLGKTNKGNLVFEYKGEKLKVSTKGEIL